MATATASKIVYLSGQFYALKFIIQLINISNNMFGDINEVNIFYVWTFKTESTFKTAVYYIVFSEYISSSNLELDTEKTTRQVYMTADEYSYSLI